MKQICDIFNHHTLQIPPKDLWDNIVSTMEREAFETRLGKAHSAYYITVCLALYGLPWNRDVFSEKRT